MKKRFTQWAQIVRAQYMTLPIVLSFLGNAYAWHIGLFSWSTAFLSLVGLMLAHMSVNVINDYFDHKSGIDSLVERSPFNGGSGSIQDAIITPKETLRVGLMLLFIAALIGVYFLITVGWMLLPLLLLSAFFVIAYSPIILKYTFAEWSAGLGLGSFPIIGTIFVQTGVYSLPMLLISIPSAVLVHHLLLINEIPDEKADRVANRKTFPIVYGKKATMNYYFYLTLLMYVFILIGCLLNFFPYWCLLSFATFPLVFKAMKFSVQPLESFQPVQQINVMHIHLTQILLGIGFLLAGKVI